MGWATPYIAQLKEGKTVSFRPRGYSMKGKIESGQLCTVEPISDVSTLAKGDIVLCKVDGNEYLHLIKVIQGPRFQIGNNRGRINGWISANSIFGRCVKIEGWESYMSVTTLEGIVRNGHILLPDGTILPESARVYVLVTDEKPRIPRILSPKLKNPADAKLFIKTVEDDIEESV